LREDDRGAAGLRSDMPHRARRWAAGNSDV